MRPISYKRHRFPPEVILQPVWLYFKFTVRLRDVEEVLAERGIDVTYETVRCWAEKFGRVIAANIRRSSPRRGNVWHLDEMVVRIHGKRMFMWRAVDNGGEVPDVLVPKGAATSGQPCDYWNAASSAIRDFSDQRFRAAASVSLTAPRRRIG